MAQSPCINNCEMDKETGYCRGCGRTLDEIARWSAMSEREHLEVLGRLPARKESVKTRR